MDFYFRARFSSMHMQGGYLRFRKQFIEMLPIHQINFTKIPERNVHSKLEVLVQNIQDLNKEKMTALMVTHNMEHALRYGNRLVMMHQGRILVDIDGEQKTQLTIDDLVRSFEQAAGEQFKDDSILLTHD